MSRLCYLNIKFFIAIILALITACDQKEQSKVETETALTTVRFGMLPYADHTYGIIGIEQNWFKDVGINLEYQVIKVEQIVPYLKNKTLDIVSTPPGILFAAYDNAPGLASFVFGDLFQGYAIMAQPGRGYRSYHDFVAGGLAPKDALRATAEQMRGKTFAYPPEAAIKPFIGLCLNAGQLSANDFKALVLDDPLTVNAMRQGTADFQVGGVPSRLILQREGFIPILSSVDFAANAKPSPDSPELASILQNGWATRKDYYEQNREFILRLAAVNYRIMKFINTDTDKALSIHMPYLTQVTGEPFTEKEGKIIYKYLNPFVTFDDQYKWFHDKDSPFYFININGSILNSFKRENVFKKEPPTVQDVIYADQVYFELEKLRDHASALFQTIDNAKLSMDNITKEKLARAHHHFENFNFYDAERLAREVATTLGLEGPKS